MAPLRLHLYLRVCDVLFHVFFMSLYVLDEYLPLVGWVILFDVEMCFFLGKTMNCAPLGGFIKLCYLLALLQLEDFRSSVREALHSGPWGGVLAIGCRDPSWSDSRKS